MNVLVIPRLNVSTRVLLDTPIYRTLFDIKRKISEVRTDIEWTFAVPPAGPNTVLAWNAQDFTDAGVWVLPVLSKVPLPPVRGVPSHQREKGEIAGISSDFLRYLDQIDILYYDVIISCMYDAQFVLGSKLDYKAWDAVWYDPYYPPVAFPTIVNMFFLPGMDSELTVLRTKTSLPFCQASITLTDWERGLLTELMVATYKTQIHPIHTIERESEEETSQWLSVLDDAYNVKNKLTKSRAGTHFLYSLFDQKLGPGYFNYGTLMEILGEEKGLDFTKTKKIRWHLRALACSLPGVRSLPNGSFERVPNG